MDTVAGSGGSETKTFNVRGRTDPRAQGSIPLTPPFGREAKLTPFIKLPSHPRPNPQSLSAMTSEITVLADCQKSQLLGARGTLGWFIHKNNLPPSHQNYKFNKG
jgi:hypothetical protein